jgi:hypothetical protein
MADAINTGNPVNTTNSLSTSMKILMVVVQIRIHQEVDLAFRDTNGRMTLPRTLTESKKAAFP